MAHKDNHDNSNIGSTVLLNLVITVAQVIGGLWSGSLALLSDAAHNSSDVLALIISFFAKKISKKDNTKTKTFGYKRAEILAALLNIISIIFIASFIFIEAIRRWGDNLEINGLIVILLALLSILVNGGSVLLLKKESKENMNMRAAYVHLLSDLLTSIAVLITGILIYFFKLYWIDSILSIIIAFYLVYVSLQILFESIGVLMQFAPKDFDLDIIISEIEETKGIMNVHHVHLWQLTDHKIHFEAHIEFDKDYSLSKVNELLIKTRSFLKENGITHIILEPEYHSNHRSKTIKKNC